MSLSNPEEHLPGQVSTIGRRLRLLRRLFGYSQNELALLLGLHRTTYTCYEMDKIKPQVSTILELAHFYQVSTDYLLGLGEDEDIFDRPVFPFPKK